MYQDTTFNWTHFGHPNNSVDMNPDILMPFDAVITIGRTVLLAAALMKPVFMFDIHGSDGWLTKENFEAISCNNFSGRTYQTRPTFEEWQEQFSLKPHHTDLTAIAYKVWENYSLSKRVSQLITLYNAVEPETPAFFSERKKLTKPLEKYLGKWQKQ